MKPAHFISGAPEMVEKYLDAIQNKHSKSMWFFYNLSIDTISVGELTTEYYSNSIFGDKKVFLLRNVDNNSELVLSFLEEIKANPLTENIVLLTADSMKFTTRLGKFLKANAEIKDFEVKDTLAFDLIDALSRRNTKKVIHFSSMILEREDFNSMALLGLLISHFILLKKAKEFEHEPVSKVAQILKQNQYRMMKVMEVCKFWKVQQIDACLQKIQSLDSFIKTWQYDTKTLVGMYLIKICMD